MTTLFHPFQSFSKFPCKRAKKGENDKNPNLNRHDEELEEAFFVVIGTLRAGTQI
jgi:hypothetical protein